MGPLTAKVCDPIVEVTHIDRGVQHGINHYEVYEDRFRKPKMNRIKNHPGNNKCNDKQSERRQ